MGKERLSIRITNSDISVGGSIRGGPSTFQQISNLTTNPLHRRNTGNSKFGSNRMIKRSKLPGHKA
eukprot:6142028-Karenia_brevis.AAC.1